MSLSRAFLIVSAGVCASAAFQPLPGYKTSYEIVTQGSGDTIVAKGASVKVHATGTVEETGKKFWSTKDPGQQPFGYNAGVGSVITGWDQGADLSHVCRHVFPLPKCGLHPDRASVQAALACAWAK